MLSLGVIICTALIAKAQWVPITSPSPAKLDAIHFIDSQTGFCAGGFGNTLETTDGGDSWIIGASQGFRDFSFFDSTFGYGASIVTQSMAQTTNGGSSWTSITPPSSNSLWAVSATSATTAYFVGTGGVLWKTTNSGMSVTVQNTGTTNLLTDVVFTNTTTGYIVTQSSGVIKTEDSGTTWIPVYTPPSGSLTEMFFVDDNIGYVVGTDGLVAKTIDAGQSWNNLTTNSTSYLQGVNFFDADNGVVVGVSGEILFTSDGGATWSSQNSGTSEHLYDVSMISATSAIVIGDNGTILKNNNLIVGVGVEEAISPIDLKFYPNPTSSMLVIEKPNDYKKEVEINIFDARSKFLTKKVIPTQQQRIDIDIVDYSEGIYFLQVIVEDEVLVKQILKN